MIVIKGSQFYCLKHFSIQIGKEIRANGDLLAAGQRRCYRQEVPAHILISGTEKAIALLVPEEGDVLSLGYWSGPMTSKYLSESPVREIFLGI